MYISETYVLYFVRREHAYEGKSVLARLKEEVKEVTVRIKDEVGEVKARIRAMSDREDGEEVEMEEEGIDENEEDLQVQNNIFSTM